MDDRSGRQYLVDTASAVRYLFEGIDRYEGLVRGLIPPSQAQTTKQVSRYMAAAETYAGCEFSEATLSGAVLHVAYMGLYLCSQNDVIPGDCAALVRPENKKAVRFCRGRRIHGIPLGLLVYAGRNQYCHWDDEGFDFPTSQVFNALVAAHYDDPAFDLAYELNWPSRTIKAHHVVLNELRWSSYEAYESDMRSALGIEGAL